MCSCAARARPDATELYVHLPLHTAASTHVIRSLSGAVAGGLFGESAKALLKRRTKTHKDTDNFLSR
jgi:hypothetical protein